PVYRNEMPRSGVLLQLDRSGRVTVYSGASDIGQGVNTLLCQICAEEMGCDPRDVTVVAADTDLTPVDLGAYSSRVTFMVGLAAREACEKLADKLRAAVAAKLGCAPADVRLELGTAAGPQGTMSFAETCQLAEAAEGATLAATGGYRTRPRWKRWPTTATGCSSGPRCSTTGSRPRWTLRRSTRASSRARIPTGPTAPRKPAKARYTRPFRPSPTPSTTRAASASGSSP